MLVRSALLRTLRALEANEPMANESSREPFLRDASLNC